MRYASTAPSPRTRPGARRNVHVFNPTADDDGWSTEPLGRPGRRRRHAVPRRLRRRRARRGFGPPAVHLVVHPQMTVRRNVTGELTRSARHSTAGGSDGRSRSDDGAVRRRDRSVQLESWMHARDRPRSTRPSAARLTERLRARCSSTSATSVEDWAKMRAHALTCAERPRAPTRRRGTRPGTRRARPRRFLRLARRQPLHVPRLPRVRPRVDRRAATDDCAPSVPGTGLGLLRYDRPSAGDGRLVLTPGAQPSAREPRMLDHHQGQLARHRAPRRLPRLRRASSASTPSGQVHRRAALPRPVHLDRLHRVGAATSRSSTTRRRRCWRRSGFTADSHSGKDLLADPGDLPARRALPDQRRELSEIATGRAAPAGAPQDQAVPAP